MSQRHIVAIDLGASSGRVMLAYYDAEMETFELQNIHRFTNQLQQQGKQVCWDLDAIEKEILTGLNAICLKGIKIDSIGIDSWGVDYVLLDKLGQRVGPSYAYRDPRSDRVMEKVQQQLGIENIYNKTGIQFLPFNTLYQLKAMQDQKPDWLSDVTAWLMIPDYFIYRLTGKFNREYTNATTTQLVNLDTGDWDQELLHYLNLPTSWFSTISQPGQHVGYWSTPTGEKIPVISVASHDTACAVIAAPLSQNSAYLSSGTWSLMGIESNTPYVDECAFNMNITNEGGINQHYRVLKNIMGLWLFQRVCQEHHIENIESLLVEVAQLPPFTCIIQPNEIGFLNPPSMSDEIRAACRRTQQTEPQSAAELARCIFDSLALLYRQVLTQLASLQGYPIERLHIVGGGSQNSLLNQLCADVCDITVTAGPVEATALGNVGCQLMALGEINNLSHFREVVRQHFPLHCYQPNLSFELKQFCYPANES